MNKKQVIEVVQTTVDSAILEKKIDEANDLIEEIKAQKKAAYRERNLLVKCLAEFFPSHVCIDESEPDPEFRWVVCIHSPAGQLTWHLHNSEAQSFRSLFGVGGNHFDGHTTDEKYKRLDELRKYIRDSRELGERLAEKYDDSGDKSERSAD